MSSHAWLDSLSEDWPSQPASPNVSKPGTRNGTATSDFRASGTKIPQPSSGQGAYRRFAATPDRSSSIVLSERSPSEINIHVHPTKRTPSKLSQEIKHPSHRGRITSRSISESPAGSVIHNTVQHKSLSSSPEKNKCNTPEWRRRLIHGDLPYGEQRDLFTSAATGLEGMFKPPAPAQATFAQPDNDDSRLRRDETTCPSSPPIITGNYSNYDDYTDRYTEQELPEQIQPTQPKDRVIKYRLANEISENSDMSVWENSKGDGAATADFSQISAPSLAPGIANADPRKISNQSTARHEDFSPILIARHSSEDGQISFQPLNLSPAELNQRLEKLQKDQMLFNGSDGGRSQVEGKSSNTEATENLERLGSYVNLRRGGRSADDSFRHNGLASALGNTSEMLPEESLQASTPKQFPSIRIHEPDGHNFPPRTPSPPAAPFPSPDKKALQAQGNGASPLKLFGQYDTFTNQTLLRRISQFEDPKSSPESDRTSNERKTSGLSPKHPAKAASRTPSDSRTTTRGVDLLQKPRSVSQFGAGELDGFEFNEDFSRLSNESGDGSVVHRSISLDVTSDSSHSEGENLSIGKRRQKPGNISLIHLRTRSEELAAQAVSGATVMATTEQQYQVPEYKRPRTSPSKDPTPKRRRTLHESDIAFSAKDNQGLDSIQDSHQQVQLAVGRQHEDSYAGDQQTANSKVLASRQNRRPRTPSPSERSSLQAQEYPDADINALRKEVLQSPQKSQHSKLPAGGERKPSIRTEDFINEAHRIMAVIRGKGGLQGGLMSVDDSEAEHNRQAGEHALEDASFQESTREPFSRPPSREGMPIPRQVNRQEDPELLTHLKKYEEHSDMGDIIASSLRSLGVSKEDIRAVQTLEQNSHGSSSEKTEGGILEDSEIVSDPPNIRISENPHRYENTTAAEQAQQFRDRLPSNSSGSESGYSTGHSIRTGSSRASENRRTIAPESVSHLIPNQVGNMVLDRHRNIWVKTKKTHVTRTKRSNTLLSENSEDDPFADIPDLTVDISRELQNLRLRGKQRGTNGIQAAGTRKSPRSQSKRSQGGSLKSILVKDGGPRQSKNDSTRSPSKLMKQFAELSDEDVEHEITIHEDRLDDSSPKRRMTISFSSPIASIIQDVVARGRSEEQELEASILEKSASYLRSSPRNEKHGRRSTVSIQAINSHAAPRPRSSSSAPSRRMSLKGEKFVPRPVSTIEERDEESHADKAEVSKELSIVGDQSLAEQKSSQPRKASVSILLTTPAGRKTHPRPENAEVLGQYVGNMSLSPLSDFTAHRDRSYAFELSYVLGDQNLVTGDGSKQHMSQAVRHLVDKIAEMEAYEPFWEDLKELELCDKRLSSLHMLDRFCGRLVKLDVSRNSVRALDGIPCSVRDLSVTHNLLSELTAWDRLANLQYINVSNNDIKSLSAFKHLVHLRGLVADNTGLVNLDGIKYHDSLLDLRARGNSIEELDFDGTSLQRLTRLDLEGNNIRKLENLQELSSMSYLNLKGNQLVEFNIKEPMQLKHLIVSDNKLKSLDVASMSRLHLIYADRNKLTTVGGLSRVPHLDSLSLREQGGSKPFDMSFLASAYEVRKLFLSGNRLSGGQFVPPRDYLNLQLLDLANCGLSRLPHDLGEMMPNLRVVNLNFNGLSDLSGLSNIPRLKRLHAAGNRVAEVRPLLKVLGQFPWLTEVDLRDNPVSQGFYPPVHVIHKQKDNAQNVTVDLFKLPDADTERDAKFCSRLDMDTRIRRRTYERKFVRGCKQLQKLDGLPANKNIRHLRDAVWREMVTRGLLLKPDGKPFDLSKHELKDGGQPSYESDEETGGGEKTKGEGEKDEKKGQEMEESRWGAEDSFAGW